MILAMSPCSPPVHSSLAPMNLLRLFVVSLFAATEALVLPGASSRLVTKPQLKLQVQMSEPDTITSEEKTSSAKTFDAEEKTSSSSTLPANYDVELASKLLIEALQNSLEHQLIQTPSVRLTRTLTLTRP